MIIKKSEKAVSIIADYIKEKDIVVVLGAPVAFYNQIYNCAVVLDNSGVKGIVPKKHLANYNEFYEKGGLHQVLILNLHSQYLLQGLTPK